MAMGVFRSNAAVNASANTRVCVETTHFFFMAGRKGDQLIKFETCSVVIFLFHSLLKLACLNCYPVPRGTRNHPHEAR